MIVIDEKVHRTGEKFEHKIPLSTFEVTCTTKAGEKEGESGKFEAVDEGDAISQFIKKNDIKIEKTPSRKFKAVAVKENRSEVLDLPEPKAKVLSASKKASSKKAATKKDS